MPAFPTIFFYWCFAVLVLVLDVDQDGGGVDDDVVGDVDEDGGGGGGGDVADAEDGAAEFIFHLPSTSRVGDLHS